MDFLESDEHRDLRAAVGAIAGSFGGSYYTQHARAGTPCDELWTALGDAGFIGVNVAEEYGGGGGGLVELAIVCEEIASHGAPLLLLLVSAAISAEVIGEFGSPELRKEWLPGLASGRTKVVFAVTEPDAGSNTHRLATTATRAGDEWVLSGTKHYISGVDEAEALMVVARTGRTSDGSPRLSLFVVPTDAPGLQKTPLPVDIQLPDKQFVLHFDDVRLPAEALVGEEGAGFRQVFHGLNPERITGAALGVGVARYALRQAAAYATTTDGVGDPHRRPPGRRASARPGEDRDRAGRAHDAQGRLAARPRPARGRGGQHGQVRRRRGRAARAGRRDPDPTAGTAWPASTASSRTGGSPDCSASPR